MIEDNKTVELILDTLGQSVWGMTIEEISKKTRMHRNTISKYMQKLEEAGVVVKKQIGKYTFWLLKSVYRYYESDMVKRFLESIIRISLFTSEKCGVGPEDFGRRIGEEITKITILEHMKKGKIKEGFHANTFKELADIYMPTIVPKLKVKILRPDFTEKMIFINLLGCPNRIEEFEYVCQFFKGYIRGVLETFNIDYKSVEIVDAKKDEGLCRYGIIFNRALQEIILQFKEHFKKMGEKS